MIENEVAAAAVAVPDAPTADAGLRSAWPPLFAVLELQCGAGVGFLQTAVPLKPSSKPAVGPSVSSSIDPANCWWRTRFAGWLQLLQTAP